MSVDYRKFLSKPETLVLPYFGGTRVDAANRRYRIVGDPEPGWWSFAIDRRQATAVSPATPTDLSALPAVHGHWVDGWLVANGKELERIALPPEDEPAPLARITGRRWYSGELLLESTDFEDDAEIAARRALEDRQPIGGVAAVVPSLRFAFGFAFGMAVAREEGIPVTLHELTPQVAAIAQAGRDAATPLFASLIARRREAEREVQRRIEAAEAAARAEAELAAEREREAVLDAAARTARVVLPRRPRNPTDRADAALEAAGARMLSCRTTGHRSRLEVTFRIDGVRIISTVDATTLQVLDAGICLSGSDRQLTLDSLPSVVREAIATRRLNITRH